MVGLQKEASSSADPYKTYMNFKLQSEFTIAVGRLIAAEGIAPGSCQPFSPGHYRLL